MRGGRLRGRQTTLGAIALGGVIGAEARHAAVGWLAPAPNGFPWSTLLINVSGCLLIGILMVIMAELTSPHRLVRPFLGVGILGGYTTFSAYAVDAQQLLVDGRWVLALAYLTATPALALVAVWTGAAVARTITDWTEGAQ